MIMEQHNRVKLRIEISNTYIKILISERDMFLYYLEQSEYSSTTYGSLVADTSEWIYWLAEPECR